MAYEPRLYKEYKEQIAGELKDKFNYKSSMQVPKLEKLDWSDESSAVFQRWKEFRNQVLMEHVVTEEDKEGNLIQYLYNHEFYFEIEESYKLTKQNKQE